jgi:hypothetical protein
MGTVAWTANVGYRLSFADQGKQTYVFRFHQFSYRYIDKLIYKYIKYLYNIYVLQF